MPITKADIQAELMRRQAVAGGSAPSPQQSAQPQQSMGDRVMGAAGDVLPFAGGALGGMAGMAATPVGGPAMPFAGAGLGYAAGKGLVRGIQQMRGKEPPEGMLQGLGTASKDVAAGMGMEMAPLAMAKGVSGALKLGGKIADTVLPGLLRVTANVPQEATKYALEHPGEVLNMTAPQAKQAIESTIGLARDGFSRFIAQKQTESAARLGQISQEVGTTVRGMGDTIGKWKDSAENALVGARSKEGVQVPIEEKIANVLGKNKVRQAILSPDAALKTTMGLEASIKGSDPMEAFNKLMDHSDALDRSMASVKDEGTMMAYNIAKQKTQQLMGTVPLDAKQKAEEIGYRQGLQSMKGLEVKFNTPGRTASVPDVTKAVDFLENNAHRLEPKQAYKMALSTRMAIDRNMPSNMTTQDAAFMADRRTALQDVMTKIPGMDHLKSMDAVYHAAADADRSLSDAFQSSTKTKNFLDKVFSGEDPQSPELMQKLMALEKRSGQPVLQKLQGLWEEKKVVEGAKYPFENEFSDPGTTEKFMHGLFTDGRSDPASRYKLSQVKKVLGSQLVDEMFKGFAADAFHQSNVRSYVANRVIGGAATTAAMAPFMGLGRAVPYLAGTAAMGTLASRGVMGGAIKAGAGAGALAEKAAAKAMTPQVMKMMTAIELLKNRRKQEN